MSMTPTNGPFRLYKDNMAHKKKSHMKGAKIPTKEAQLKTADREMKSECKKEMGKKK